MAVKILFLPQITMILVDYSVIYLATKEWNKSTFAAENCIYSETLYQHSFY